MTFSVSYRTRHTDTYAATGFVHAGVMLALTEMAYAAFETHCGITKPEHIVAVERETQATYHAPLRWQEGATVEVRTTEMADKGFTQEFTVRSTRSGSMVASFVHRWVWLDTHEGRRVNLPEDAQKRLLEG